MNNKLKVGDLLKYSSGTSNSFCIVTRIDDDYFDVFWLVARDFEDNPNSSRNHPTYTCRKYYGWSKLS